MCDRPLSPSPPGPCLPRPPGPCLPRPPGGALDRRPQPGDQSAMGGGGEERRGQLGSGYARKSGAHPADGADGAAGAGRRALATALNLRPWANFEGNFTGNFTDFTWCAGRVGPTLYHRASRCGLTQEDQGRAARTETTTRAAGVHRRGEGRDTNGAHHTRRRKPRHDKSQQERSHDDSTYDAEDDRERAGPDGWGRARGARCGARRGEDTASSSRRAPRAADRAPRRGRGAGPASGGDARLRRRRERGRNVHHPRRIPLHGTERDHRPARRPRRRPGRKRRRRPERERRLRRRRHRHDPRRARRDALCRGWGQWRCLRGLPNY